MIVGNEWPHIIDIFLNDLYKLNKLSKQIEKDEDNAVQLRPTTLKSASYVTRKYAAIIMLMLPMMLKLIICRPVEEKFLESNETNQ